VYIELPKPGARFESHQPFGTVESVKAVSELFVPVGGEVIEVNSALKDSPETLNSDPYGHGWLIRLKIPASADTSSLLSAKAYGEYVKTQG